MNHLTNNILSYIIKIIISFLKFIKMTLIFIFILLFLHHPYSCKVFYDYLLFILRGSL